MQVNNGFLLMQVILQICAGLFFIYRSAYLLGALQITYAIGNIILMFLKLQ